MHPSQFLGLNASPMPGTNFVFGQRDARLGGWFRDRFAGRFRIDGREGRRRQLGGAAARRRCVTAAYRIAG
jgi:hypothetical protein